MSEIYKIETGIIDWFIAAGFEQLISELRKHYGESYLNDEFSEGVTIHKLPRRAKINIVHSDNGKEETGNRTAEEWLEYYKHKPGMLCSSEW